MTIPPDGIPNPTYLPSSSQKYMSLSPNQREAIKMLLLGATDAEVAQQLEVGRNTLWRWQTQDPNFIAVWNQLSELAWDALVCQLQKLISSAVGVIREALDGKDTAVAIALLEAMGGNWKTARGGDVLEHCQDFSTTKVTNLARHLYPPTS